jgi:predicted permease
VYVLLDSFLFSINTILPIFIVAILGALLKNFLTPAFFTHSERLVFKVALPALLFLEVARSDLQAVFRADFIAYCVGGIVVSFALLCLIVPIFIKSNDKRGAFIQGAYRSNFAILGVPLAKNMFGKAGTTQIAVVMPFAIMLFNVFATIILCVYQPKEKQQKAHKAALHILLNMVTNPLIIAVALAVPFMLFHIGLPVIFDKSLTYLANMSLPLALLSLGANCTLKSFKGRLSMALISSSIKTIVIPLAAVLTAIFLGFRNEQLGVILILFGGPTAVSSYIMAKNMDSDYELAGQVMLISTLMCVFTLFIGTFVLKLNNYI